MGLCTKDMKYQLVRFYSPAGGNFDCLLTMNSVRCVYLFYIRQFQLGGTGSPIITRFLSLVNLKLAEEIALVIFHIRQNITMIIYRITTSDELGHI